MILTRSPAVPTEAERIEAWRKRQAAYVKNPALFVAIVRRMRKAKEKPNAT